MYMKYKTACVGYIGQDCACFDRNTLIKMCNYLKISE